MNMRLQWCIKKSLSNKREIYQTENNSEKHLGLPVSQKDKNYLEKELSMFPLTARSLLLNIMGITEWEYDSYLFSPEL